MDRLTGARSPTKENEEHKAEQMRNLPSNAMPSRSGTVSWQQRPKSRAGRALSVIASENAAARSPRATPEIGGSRPTSSYGAEAAMGRDAIAQSLDSKSPEYLRQTADGGRGAGAYRTNQVEDKDTVEGHTGGQRIQLPGLSGLGGGKALDYGDDTPARPMSSDAMQFPDHLRVSRPEEEESDNDRSRSRTSTLTGHPGLRDVASPLPITSEQRLPPPTSTTSPPPAMSPSQGRLHSPERLERPPSASPTKGMGGFVQSAMMKRSDSVNKRWSVQSPGRQQSVLGAHGNRASIDMGSPYGATSGNRLSSHLSRDTTPLSRPGSSHDSNTTYTRDSNVSGLTGSRPNSSYYLSKSQEQTDDGFAKPGIPASMSYPVLDPSKSSFDSSLARPETPLARPLSASKTGGGRWSPTKSSWLENALKKEDSPKPKLEPSSPTKPSWMEQINKNKQKAEEPTNGAAKTEEKPVKNHRHQVSIEGLIRSPGMGASEKPKNISALAAKFAGGGASSPLGSPAVGAAEFRKKSEPELRPAAKSFAEERKGSFTTDTRPSARSIIEERRKSFVDNSTPVGKSLVEEENQSLPSLAPSRGSFMDEARPEPAKRISSESVMPEEPVFRTTTPKPIEQHATIQTSIPTPVLNPVFKPKASEPPKFDFRGNLKPKAPPPSTSGTNEPEFKNVFGQLRRTRTQKYEAPDVLKDNILRGMHGLAQTGGPQKSERKDEFKDAILQKKETFKKAEQDGKSINQLEKEKREEGLPEALRKKAALGRSNTVGEEPKVVDVASPSAVKRPETLPFRERAKSFAKKQEEETFSPSSAQKANVERALTVPARSRFEKEDDKENPAPAPGPKKMVDIPGRSRTKSISEKAAMFGQALPGLDTKKSAAPLGGTRSREAKKESPKESPKDEFGPPLRRITADGPERKPASKFGQPRLTKEESAPGRLQGKVSGKLADRFNPALAGLLAKGPPAPGADGEVTTTTDTPVKKDDEDKGPSPTLTHMTKARARGPKRRTPTNIESAITAPLENKPSSPVKEAFTSAEPVKEVAKPVEVKDTSSPRALSLKTKKSSLGSISLRSQFIEEAASPSKIVDEPAPSSPRKLDLRRRSAFLADAQVSSVPTKEEPKVEEKREPLIVNKARAPSLVNNDRDLLPSQRNSMPKFDSPARERVFSPPTKPKPLSLSSPPADATKFDSIERTVSPPGRVMSPHLNKESLDLGSFDFESSMNSSMVAQASPEQVNHSIVQSPVSTTGTFGGRSKPSNVVLPHRKLSVVHHSPEEQDDKFETATVAPVYKAYRPPNNERKPVTTPPVRQGTFGSSGQQTIVTPVERKTSQDSNTNDDKVDTESIASVKSFKSIFGGGGGSFVSRSEKVRSPAMTKAPIKLPTMDDENEAMVKAGLRSPSLRSDYGSDRGSINERSNSPNMLRSIPSPAMQRNTPSPSMQRRELPQPVREPVKQEPARDIPSPVFERQPYGSSRPLPIPPLRWIKTPPPIVPQPLSPRKSAGGHSASASTILSPRSTETSRTLAEFFNNTSDVPKNVKIDTAEIITLKVDLENVRIRTLSVQLYQIGPDGKKMPVTRGQERMLFEGNMYLCTHVLATESGRKNCEVYFWIGDDVPEQFVHDAEVLAIKESRAAGGKYVKLRQGKESVEFIDALEGTIVVHRGQSQRFDARAPRMLCCRSYAGRIVVDEVDFSPMSLCSGYPYIVSTSSGKCYLWKGRGSGVDELSSARLIGMDYGLSGEITEIEDGRESQYFLDEFGRGTIIYKSAEHWRLKPLYEKYTTRLFVADTAAGRGSGDKVRDSNSSLPIPSSSPIVRSPSPSWSPFNLVRRSTPAPEYQTRQLANHKPDEQVREISPFCQKDLRPENVYILDAYFELYIVVGKESREKYDDFCAALVFAQEYGILTAGMEDRPFVPVSTVVLEGVPRDLKGVFRKWRDVDSPLIMKKPSGQQTSRSGGLRRGKSLRVVRLNDALDAVRL